MKAHEIANKEELIKALRRCGRRLFSGYDCKDCVMYGDPMCDDSLKCRAADALEAVKSRIVELEKDIIYWQTYAAEVEDNA